MLAVIVHSSSTTVMVGVSSRRPQRIKWLIERIEPPTSQRTQGLKLGGEAPPQDVTAGFDRSHTSLLGGLVLPDLFDGLVVIVRLGLEGGDGAILRAPEKSHERLQPVHCGARRNSPESRSSRPCCMSRAR